MTIQNDTLEIRHISVGSMDNNVYVVVDRATGEGVIIDPANEAARILEAAEGAQVRSILLTHGHVDHVQALEEVRAARSVPFGIHPADADMAPIPPDFEIQDGDEISFGQTTLKAMHTPGHTPGSVCFYTPGYLISGDTLFPDGPGNAWGNRAAFDQIMKHIRVRLF